MLAHGRNGLKEKALGILNAQKKLKEAFKNDEHIETTSKHSGPIFSFTSKTVNAIAMAELLKKKRKWIVACLQMPPGAHLAITAANCPHVDDLADSIKECT